ncbi:hypothetical protein ASPZODRAFT_21543 [Penicilliopsis zonata CBS 506.65]|uniref:Uncharacterized protein n=1 Tax=Penicilliopsis zonata CBS 506.65 TaxID=1073090 RepID=A0A1L9SV14_9EURO|nr:hypothetical protein ASPZODRAFT_21543 [Penicilliopsis zonata CBS 506.65]OJJ51039.1 hypothetical protein ASPZODRAFT_21543 [Penicilliopsis zonata CBS 506.65]
MPSSKTDTSVRFPEREDQKRRLRNTTQDQKATSRMKDAASSGKNRVDDINSWSPEQLLSSSMDDQGNPVPDPVTFHDGAKARKGKNPDDEPDLYDAMHDDFD